MTEKQRILRLIRALDRAGVAPDEIPALRAPLVRLAEADELLTAMLELFDRVRDNGSESRVTLMPFLSVCEAARGEVLDVLAPRDQAAVQRASSEVAATEAEVWLEVEGFRRRSKGRVRRRPVPMDDEGAQRAAERALASPRMRRPEGWKLVAEQERSELPDDDAPVEEWLNWLPDPWLRAVARIHGVKLEQDLPSLIAALSRRLAEPSWLAGFLADHLGTGEREILMAVLEYSGVALGKGANSLSDAFAVHWDWEGGTPAASGGRLRSAGLVYVGVRAGTKVVTIPTTLRPLLVSALKQVDPELLDATDRAHRALQAERLKDEPHDDPDLDRWRKADRSLSRWLQKHCFRDALQDDAITAYFGGAAREVYSEVESTALLEFVALDYRATPGESTALERLLAQKPPRDSQVRSLAQAVAAARPALYRVASLRRGQDLTLQPIWPVGEPIVVTDRSASLTAEEGWLLVARLYPAGRHTFARLVSDPHTADRERRILRELERSRASVGATDVAPADYLSAHPEALIHAMRKAAR